ALREPFTPLIMHPALSSLILIALHVCVPVSCAPRLLAQHQQAETTNTGTHTHTSAAGRHTHWTGSVRQVILPKRTATNSFVSIFDLRRRRFLCLDFKGQLYHSVSILYADREACFFLRIWLSDHRDVLYSASSGRLLRPAAGELRWAEVEPPERPSAQMERLVKRRRRSGEVNPSDPLRTESHPSLSVKDADQPEQDQTGAVSKETIDSCHDPLRVLQPNAPGSPMQDRARHKALEGAPMEKVFIY
uniref:Fibroblast growth factor 23 n=1 Tax=Salarias fasciatus TaxID=181472 RepID=A0A672HPF6_SALFA